MAAVSRRALGAASLFVLLAIAVPAIAAPSVTGPPAARRLAAAVVRAFRTAPAISTVARGGFYLCPSKAAFPPLTGGARRPGRGCAALTISGVENLRNGHGADSVFRQSARGFPTRTFISNDFGAWKSTDATRCWRYNGLVSHGPPFVYTGERVRITGRGGGHLALSGVGDGISEVDTIDARSSRLLSTRVAYRTPRGRAVERTTVSYLTQAQPIPSPTPLCPGEPDIAISSKSPNLEAGAAADITVRPLFEPRAGEAYELHVAPAPYRRYSTEMNSNDLIRPSGVTQAFLPLGRGFVGVNRNFRAFVSSPGHRSNTITVLVPPLTSLGLAATADPAVQRATVLVGIHPLRHYPRSRVFFYVRPNGTRAYTLVGSQRLRHVARSAEPMGLTALQASIRFRPAGAKGRIVTCVQRPIVADMGAPFRNRLCGRARTTVFP